MHRSELTASVIRELKRRKARYGMVTMCVGGGMARRDFRNSPVEDFPS